jgi:chorismate mutase
MPTPDDTLPRLRSLTIDQLRRLLANLDDRATLIRTVIAEKRRKPASQPTESVERKIARGLRGQCGKEPLSPDSKRYGPVCLAKIRERTRTAMRKKLGCKPWVKGGRGRPPKDRGNEGGQPCLR